MHKCTQFKPACTCRLPILSCIAVIDCGIPNDVDFATFPSTQKTTFQSVVNYTCNIGYNSSTPLTSECDVVGQWSTPQTTCQRKFRLERDIKESRRITPETEWERGEVHEVGWREIIGMDRVNWRNGERRVRGQDERERVRREWGESEERDVNMRERHIRWGEKRGVKQIKAHYYCHHYT